jgi:hypothetical protein
LCRPCITSHFLPPSLPPRRTLSAPEQALLLQGLTQLKPSDRLWVTAALFWYNGTAGRSGYLTFEELGEALHLLAHGVAGDGGVQGGFQQQQQQQQQGRQGPYPDHMQDPYLQQQYGRPGYMPGVQQPHGYGQNGYSSYPPAAGANMIR